MITPIYLPPHWLGVLFVVLIASAPGVQAQAPSITSRPLSRAVVAGQSASFTVTATGAGPVSYQWRHNGQLIPAVTGATHTIPAASLADRGWYHVTVSNSAGVATSVFVLEVGLADAKVVSWGGIPSSPASLGSVIAISSGAAGAHVLAVRANGTVAAWGADFNGEGTVPTGLTDVVGLAAGRSSSLAIRADGSVVNWGGGLGAPPPEVNGVVAASIGWFHALALKADGTVAAWGGNADGQRSVPASLRDVVSVAAGGFHSLALLADGTVVAWGSNSAGQCNIPANLGTVVAIAAGTQHNLALRADGTVVAWGQNYSGSTEVPSSLSGVVAIAAGESHSVALRGDGTIAAWGRPYEGQIDVPSGLSLVSAITAGAMHGIALVANSAPTIQVQPASQVATAGDYLTLSVAATGTIPLSYQWKKNGTAITNAGNVSGATSPTLTIDGVSAGDAGAYIVEVSNANGTATSNSAPVTVLVPPTITVRPLSRLVTVGESVTFTVQATDPGTISYQWKRNGQAMAGATNPSLALPVVTMADRGHYEVIVSNATASRTSVFILDVSFAPTAGAIVVPWGTGASNYGQTTAPAELTDVVAIAAGDYHAAALKSDGTVVAWGLANYGATTVPAGLNNVVAVAAGEHHTLALKADGTVVSWGKYFDFPVPPPAGLRSVVRIATRGSSNLALKADGTVVAWGAPVAPAGLGSVINIAIGRGHSLALKSDGTVVGWGTGTHGAATVPAGLSGVIAIAAGDYHSLAVRSDGTVEAWGRNDIAQSAVPAGLGDVVAVAGGFVHSIALKSDGTVIGWGRDVEGQVSGTARLGAIAGISAGAYYNLGLAAAATPGISQHPASRVVNVGETATFSVKITGAPVPTVQWRKNGVAIAGATGLALTIPNAQSGDAAEYSVVVSNSLGTATSTIAKLTVAQPVAVTGRPLSRIVDLGQPVAFSITAAGAVSYQWKRNGQIISGAIGSTLTIPAASAADAGYYEVIATDATGGTGRAVSYLTVAPTENTLVAWGYGTSPDAYPRIYPPADLTDAVAISGSRAALRRNGTIAVWGNFAPSVPPDVSGMVAIAVGGHHLLALKGDGSVAVFGTGGYGEQDVPAGLANVVAVSASGYNSMVLRADGTVVRWGYDPYGTAAVPAGLNNVVAIAAGPDHSLALRSDGTVVAWGRNDRGQTTVSPVLNNVVAITAAAAQSMALRSNGSVAVWGDVAQPPADLGVVRLAAVGDGHAIALTADGTVRAWGRNDFTQSTVPAGLGNVIALAAEGAASLALLAQAPVPPAIAIHPASQAAVYGQTVTLSVAASGTPVMDYQWLKYGYPIYDTGSVSGTKSSTLTLKDIQSSDAGSFTVTVRNGYGSITSSAAVLTVEALQVTAQSVPVVGGSVSLAVNAPAGATYQWRYRGVPLAGATSATLALPNLSRANNGEYDVVVTTPGGAVIAHGYRLDVRPVSMPDLYMADSAFAPRFELEGGGSILAVASLPDGKFLVGGDFTRLGGALRPYLARLNADGSVDTSYTAPQLTGSVRALAVDGAGRIYVGGDFSFADAQQSGGLLRLNPNLTFDSTFAVGRGFNAPVHALATQPDGKVIVGGEFDRYGQDYAVRLARLNADASLDTTLTYANSIGPVRVLHVQPDGKVLVGGGGTGYGWTSSEGYIVRLLPSGGNDWNWAPGTFGAIRSYFGPILSVSRQPDGSWMVAGGSGYFQGAILERLSSDGAVDSSFAFDAYLKGTATRVELVAATADGKYLVAGQGFPMSRLDAQGARDTTLPAPPFTSARLVAARRQADGATRLWGAFTNPASVTGFVVLSAAGENFGPVSGEVPRSAARIFDAQQVGPSGILVRGSFTHVNDTARAGLARITSDGAVDSAFNPGTPITLADTGRFAVQGDGRILVHNGTSLIRLHPDGTTDSEFAPFAYAAGAVALDRDGKVLVANGGDGGVFGSTRGVRRLATSGALDPAFSVTVTGVVSETVTQSSGRILLGGAYATVNGAQTRGVARVFSDGSLDPSFQGGTWTLNRLHPAAGDRVYSMVYEYSSSSGRVLRFDAIGMDAGFSYGGAEWWNVPQPVTVLPLPDGKLLRAGKPVSDSANNPSWLLGRHTETGALDASFQVNGLDPLRTQISRMLLLDDGAVLVFGSHLTAFGAPRWGSLRLEPAAAVEIAAQPVTAQASPGGTATFSVIAAGTGPFSYQWYRNGQQQAGATSASLTLANLTVTDVATYVVQVTNPFGTISSAPVTITGLNPAPTITTQPASQLASAGNPATFSVVATGTGSLTYQWRRSGYPLPGANNATFVIPHASRTDAGLYDVLIADGLSVTRSAGVRLDVAPSTYPNTMHVDASFKPRFEVAGGDVNAIIPAPGGKFVLSGDFSRINGVERPGLARLDADLQIDPTFTPPVFFEEVNPANSGGPYLPKVHTVLSDGRILATRVLPHSVDQPYGNELLRLMPDGSIDPAFVASRELENVEHLAVQPDGRIITIGRDGTAPAGKRYVYRLNADGSLDAGYAPTFTSSSYPAAPLAIAIQPDGRAVFAGQFDAVNGVSAPGLARLTMAGEHDPTFAFSGSTSTAVRSVAALPDGRILAGGYFNLGTQTNRLVRIAATGGIEAGLLSTADVSDYIDRIVLGPDGKVYASAKSLGLVSTVTFCRLSPSGAIENKSIFNVFRSTWSFAVAGSDRVVGAFWPLNANSDAGTRVVRLSPDGTPDGIYAELGTLSSVNVAVPAPGGKIYVAGNFTRVNGVLQPRIVRLNDNGSRDPGFVAGTGFNSAPSHLLVLADGRLMVSGGFSEYRGTPVGKVVRLRPDGTLDPGFVAGVPPNSPAVSGALTQLADGRVLVEGARCFLPDGTVDPAFQPAAIGNIAAIPLPDGGVLAGVDWNTDRRVARLRADGSLVASGFVNFRRFTTLALLPDGRAVAGGGTTSLNIPEVYPTEARRLNADLTVDATFSLTGLPLPPFRSIATAGPHLITQEDGRVILNEVTRYARVDQNGTWDPGFQFAGVGLVIATGVPVERGSMWMRDDGSMLVTRQEFIVDGLRRRGILRLVDRAAAIIATQPLDQAGVEGDAISFSVATTSATAVTYQWLKNGAPISGGTAATFTISNVGLTDAGSYAVDVTNANGTVRSAGASLAVAAAMAPVILAQPRLRAVAPGQSATFSVTAAGVPAPTYQWRKDGIAIAGATGASHTVESVRLEDAGDYSVVISNPAGTVLSETARLSILPTGLAASHASDGGFILAGGTVTVTNSFVYTGSAPGLKWEVLLPEGWSIASSSGDSGASKPASGTTALAEWMWTTASPSPHTFMYVLNVPANAAGDQELAGLVTIQPAGDPIQLLARPDPLMLRGHHSADVDRNGRIDLVELTRVIELYNTRNGTTRTGAYKLTTTQTEDGFSGEPVRSALAMVILPRYHSADSNRDAKLSLVELTRVIELYNHRSGTVRTGQYRLHNESEDGFAPGP